jgi:hypothetical protein
MVVRVGPGRVRELGYLLFSSWSPCVMFGMSCRVLLRYALGRQAIVASCRLYTLILLLTLNFVPLIFISPLPSSPFP